MANFNMKVRHNLAQDEALRRIKELISQEKRQHPDFNLKVKWDGGECAFSCTVKGFNVSGTLQVNAGSIEIDGDRPFFVPKSWIEQTIREEVKELLS